MKLQNQVVVVTGASQGLGREISKQIANEGARVAIIARSKELLHELQSEIHENHGTAEYFVCDITDYDQIQETVEKIKSTFGTIDILINNAGVWTTDEIETTHPEKRKIALETNAYGHIEFTYAVLPIMKKKNSGQVFNVISRAGLEDPGNPNWKAYAATKWAMRGFTKALEKDLEGSGIKAISFLPGGMDTMIFENAGESEAHDQPWMMSVSDIAEIVVFTLTRPKDIWITDLVVRKKMVGRN